MLFEDWLFQLSGLVHSNWTDGGRHKDLDGDGVWLYYPEQEQEPNSNGKDSTRIDHCRFLSTSVGVVDARHSIALKS